MCRPERGAAEHSPSPCIVYAALSITAAYWPLASWYAARMRDGSDDPCGVMALLLAVVMLWRARQTLHITPAGAWLASVLVGIELLLHPVLPPLIEAGLAIATIGCLFTLWKRMPGVMALLLLSLPVVASAQFFLGYPLRMITARLSQGLLMLVGVQTELQGTQLCLGLKQVGVDAPCSGVRMLWAALFVAAMLSAKARISALSTLLLLLSAVVLALLANGVRAALLFPTEAGMINLPHVWHEGVGLAVFALLLGLLMRWQEHLPTTSAASSPVSSHRHSTRHALIALLGLGLVSGAWQLRQPELMPAAQKAVPVWPTHWDDQPLEPLPLNAREEEFARSFPGHLARFRCGGSEIILRQVSRATRALHSSRDCFQAAGYEVQDLGLWTDPQGRTWLRFIAQRLGESLVVWEIVLSKDGKTSADVGAWFWRALFHPDEGPWLATTLVERQEHPLAADR